MVDFLSQINVILSNSPLVLIKGALFDIDFLQPRCNLISLAEVSHFRLLYDRVLPLVRLHSHLKQVFQFVNCSLLLLDFGL